MQLEFDEAAWAKRALELEVQVKLLVTARSSSSLNDDSEHGAHEPLFRVIGEAAALL